MDLLKESANVVIPGLPGGTYEYGQDAGPHAVTGITLPTPEYLAADPAVHQIAYTPFNKVSNTPFGRICNASARINQYAHKLDIYCYFYFFRKIQIHCRGRIQFVAAVTTNTWMYLT